MGYLLVSSVSLAINWSLLDSMACIIMISFNAFVKYALDQGRIRRICQIVYLGIVQATSGFTRLQLTHAST